jgi:N-acetylglucosamine-6-phosphate deacetylase
MEPSRIARLPPRIFRDGHSIMPITAIYASRILTPIEEVSDAVILVEGDKITAIGHRDEIQVPPDATHFAAPGSTVVPGFIDIHIHGAGGHDVMEATPRALDKITETVARHGTTSMLATTVTAPIDETCHSLERIARYVRNHEQPQEGNRLASEIVGVHLEGPFISHARRGVHPPEALAKPSIETFEKLSKAADGLVRLLTVAPELPGALKLIAYAAQAGITVGMGHTDATYDEARAGVQAGARHAVHMYNAMRPFDHRDPGIIGAVLTDPEITAEVIADGHHVAGPAIQVLMGTKGFETVLLVSDGIAATSMRDGKYPLGNLTVTVKDGVARSEEGKLAGSTLTLDRALRFVVGLGVPFEDALRMVTIQPARRIGLAGKKGILAPGSDADIVVLTPDLRVEAVMTRGAGLI